jgi:hypothetical protein
MVQTLLVGRDLAGGILTIAGTTATWSDFLFETEVRKYPTVKETVLETLRCTEPWKAEGLEVRKVTAQAGRHGMCTHQRWKGTHTPRTHPKQPSVPSLCSPDQPNPTLSPNSGMEIDPRGSWPHDDRIGGTFVLLQLPGFDASLVPADKPFPPLVIGGTF